MRTWKVRVNFVYSRNPNKQWKARVESEIVEYESLGKIDEYRTFITSWVFAPTKKEAVQRAVEYAEWYAQGNVKRKYEFVQRKEGTE